MLRPLVLLVACQPAAVEAGRKVGSEVSEDGGLQNNALLPINTKACLSALKGDPADFFSEVYDHAAEMDSFSSGSLMTLVSESFGTALTMVNPLLGIAYSVFSGLVGMGGVDPMEQVIQNILQKVDKMITKSLSSFAHSWNRAHIASLLSNIRFATYSSDWSVISHMFNVPQIFNMSCYNKQDLSNGTYTVQWQDRRYLDATGDPSYRAKLREAQNDDSQRWLIKSVGWKLYTIQQKINNRYLDAHDAFGGSGDYDVVTRGAQNDDSQKWLIKHVGLDLFTVQQKMNNRYIDAHGESKDYNVVTRGAQNDNSQKWLIEEDTEEAEDKPEDACEHFRTKFGKGEALIIEIQYTNVMISSWMEMQRAAEILQKEQGLTLESCKTDSSRFCSDLETYTSRGTALEQKIKEASGLLIGHMDSWEKYRLRNIEKGTITFHGNFFDALKRNMHDFETYMKLTPHHDKTLEKDFVGDSCRKGGIIRKARREYEKMEFDECYADYMESVKDELAGLRKQIDAMLNLAASVMSKDGT